MRILLCHFFCFLTLALSAQLLNRDLTQVYELEYKIQTYLDNDSSLSNHYRLTDSSIQLFASQADKLKLKLEFELPFRLFHTFSNCTLSNEALLWLYKTKGVSNYALDINQKSTFTPAYELLHPLKGLRIALDPGHVASNLEEAKLESKYIDMRAIDSTLAFYEANLTLATALQLKEMLENVGATVLITRKKPGDQCYPIHYKNWLKSAHFHKDLKQAVKDGWLKPDIAQTCKKYRNESAEWKQKYIFGRFYNGLELRCRARQINDFQPHLTIFLHYNVNASNHEWSKPATKNFNMSFVAGSFANDELRTRNARMDFLRLLASTEIEESIELCSHFNQQILKHTNVPIVSTNNDEIYLNEFTLKTAIDGVYCRNLYMTRATRGVLCYGESLCQDNKSEVYKLSDKSLKVGSFYSSKRTTDVAKAYYHAIINYTKTFLKN